MIMKGIGRWLLQATLSKLATGHPITVMERSCTPRDQGTIRGLTVDPDTFSITISVLKQGEPLLYLRRYSMDAGDLQWNYTSRVYEVDHEKVVELRSGPEASGTMGGRDTNCGDREESEQGSDGSEEPSQASGIATPEKLRADRESSYRVRPGHDENPSSESQERGADSSQQNQSVGDEGHQGTLKTFVNNDIPVGFLICVDPEGKVHIRRVGTYSEGLPPGTTIWGNNRALAHIRGFAASFH